MILDILGAKEEQTIIKLALKKTYEKDGVTLYCTDSAGRNLGAANLLTVWNNGTITLHSSVDRTIGFQLDRDSKVLIK